MQRIRTIKLGTASLAALVLVACGGGYSSKASKSDGFFHIDCSLRQTNYPHD